VQSNFFCDLGPSTKVSLALDSWTSPGNRFGFLAIVVYYVSTDWKYRQVLIGFERLSGGHTGVNLAEVVVNVLGEYKLLKRIFAVTADNASNNATLRRALQSKLCSFGIGWRADAMTVNCMAHILNLSAKALLLGMTLVDEDERTSETDIEDEGSGEDDNDVSLVEDGVAPTVLKVHCPSFSKPVVADTDRP
jgi:hypothetical protein